jgi:drug/metabolite transporter (DMT)-like permease
VSLYLAGHRNLADVLRLGQRDWLLALVMGATSGLSMAAFYRALEVGTLSVVAPISSSYPALTVLMAYGSGERLTAARLLGCALTLGGVVLISLVAERGEQPADAAPPVKLLDAGALWACAATCGFGFLYWLLGFRAMPAWGALPTVWLQRASGVAVLAALAAPLGRSLAPPVGSTWALVLGVGAFDALGFVFGNLGFAHEQVSVITVLGSLFAAWTLVLALVVLKERLSRRQWAGVVLIFAGILLINSHAR